MFTFGIQKCCFNMCFSSLESLNVISLSVCGILGANCEFSLGVLGFGDSRNAMLL